MLMTTPLGTLKNLDFSAFWLQSGILSEMEYVIHLEKLLNATYLWGSIYKMLLNVCGNTYCDLVLVL